MNLLAVISDTVEEEVDSMETSLTKLDFKIKVFSSILLLCLILFAAGCEATGNTFFAEISADPTEGPAPLMGVSLTARVSGTATGPVTSRFDCTSKGTWDLTQTTSETNFTAAKLCNYLNPGNYSATISAERNGASFQGTIVILVGSK